MKTMKVEYFPVGSAFLNAVEECWRQGKYNILSHYYSSFSQVKQAISNYYRKRRFNLDIKSISLDLRTNIVQYSTIIANIDILNYLKKVK